MQVMNYDMLGNLITKLNQKGKVSNGDILMYFVSPFLKSLGYDIFDLDVVDINQHNGVAKVNVNSDLTIVVSLKDFREIGDSGFLETFDELVQDVDGREKIFLRINIEKMQITMYFKVMEDWEKILQVTLDSGEDDKYIEITKRITRDQLEREYTEKGERFLSEVVVDTLLERGNYDNDFIKNSLIKELTEPSEMFIELMAIRLGEDYTTRDVKWIKERLEGIKETGLMHLLEDVKEQDKSGTFVEEENKQEQFNRYEEDEVTEDKSQVGVEIKEEYKEVDKEILEDDITSASKDAQEDTNGYEKQVVYKNEQKDTYENEQEGVEDKDGYNETTENIVNLDLSFQDVSDNKHGKDAEDNMVDFNKEKEDEEKNNEEKDDEDGITIITDISDIFNMLKEDDDNDKDSYGNNDLIVAKE